MKRRNIKTPQPRAPPPRGSIPPMSSCPEQGPPSAGAAVHSQGFRCAVQPAVRPPGCSKAGPGGVQVSINFVESGEMLHQKLYETLSMTDTGKLADLAFSTMTSVADVAVAAEAFRLQQSLKPQPVGP